PPFSPVLFVCLLSLFAVSCARAPETASPPASTSSSTRPPALSASTPVTDAELQQAAAAALGDREGTILVAHPHTGLLRAVVNPRLAYEQAFPPGSAIKPFTLLTALRSGAAHRETRRLCAGRYAAAGYEITCSHPKSDAPFDPAQALAYSCNAWFAHVSERLSPAAFQTTLSSFGFGQKTGARVANENAGQIPHGPWHVNQALGDSGEVLVTPAQMLRAYSALLNGGRLWRPVMEAETGDTVAKRVSLSPAHRALLIEGMRGVVRRGTAADSGLRELPLTVIGKTGTSTASNGFRTNGWFAGFAAARAASPEIRPEEISAVVLVFLKRAHGADAAGVARAVFRLIDPPAPGQVTGDSHGAGAIDEQTIRVRVVRENKTHEMPMGNYLAGVLAAEAGLETERQALLAQAVVSRTFAVRNRGRHAGEGYDLCSTTHCQRFEMSGVARPEQAALVRETAHQVIRAAGGRVIDAYYHAACGGMTADIATLWGGRAQSYLRPVRDDYCTAMPHREWTETIAAAELARALRADPRAEVGATLRDIRLQPDATGRAETLIVTGARTRELRGWDFKMLVGRTLGWNHLKSSKFTVRRAGANFVFRGQGFGHGLGLCQEGAHVMARRGMHYRQILTFYYSGVTIDAGGN
ncbi:MAG: SpoIID/LytB domain-containing protein, partial [Blastocatellia bacterium]